MAKEKKLWAFQNCKILLYVFALTAKYIKSKNKNNKERVKSYHKMYYRKSKKNGPLALGEY